jgi:hypothetical protein
MLGSLTRFIISLFVLPDLKIFQTKALEIRKVNILYRLNAKRYYGQFIYNSIHFTTIKLCQNLTSRPGQVINTPASYSGALGSYLDPKTGCSKVFRDFAHSSQPNAMIVIELGHNRFLQYPFQFPIH